MQDTKFMSARDKELVLQAWERFLKNGLRPEDFTQRLYDHLIQHCSFIAHYDRGGFYGTYFRCGEATAHFLSQFDKSKAGPGGVPKSIEYGMTYWATNEEYADINQAMVEVATQYIPLLTHRAAHAQKEADIQQARALLRRQGIEIDLMVKVHERKEVNMNPGLKVSIVVNGGDCIVGLQDPNTDPIISVITGSLDDVLSQVPALVARARVQWADAPKYPKAVGLPVEAPPVRPQTPVAPARSATPVAATSRMF